MPCYTSPEENAAYERMDNVKKFGTSDLTLNIAITVACELAKVIKKHALHGELSTLARKWVANHEKEDADRQAAKKEKQDKAATREKALAKLTVAERKLFSK